MIIIYLLRALKQVKLKAREVKKSKKVKRKNKRFIFLSDLEKTKSYLGNFSWTTIHCQTDNQHKLKATETLGKVISTGLEINPKNRTEKIFLKLQLPNPKKWESWLNFSHKNLRRWRERPWKRFVPFDSVIERKKRNLKWTESESPNYVLMTEVAFWGFKCQRS